MSDELFHSVDALLAAVDSGQVLPPPAERERLRCAARLTQAVVAQTLRVRPATIEAWEAGRSEPTGAKQEAYRLLLEGLAARFPAPAREHPMRKEAPTAAPASQEMATSQAPVSKPAMTPPGVAAST